MSDIIKMERDGGGRDRVETERQSTLHTVIMKDLGHVTKKQGTMVTIQHIVQELRK